MSSRASRPFLALNCAAISPNLVEPTLFGYAKGAFTGATTLALGLLRGREGLDAVPRRDRRAAARAAGEAPARAGERGVPARRRDPEPGFQRARHRRHQPRPAPGGARRAASAQDLYHRLSRVHHRRAAAARAGRRQAAAPRSLPRVLRPPGAPGAASSSDPRWPCSSGSSTASRATRASCATS